MKLFLGTRVSWIDDRLTFQKVNQDKLNLVSPRDQINQLWIPEIIFDNSQDKAKLDLNDEASQTNIKISKDAKGKMAPMTELYNSKEFNGFEG